MTKFFASLAVCVALFAATAQAALIPVDSININIRSSAAGDVTSGGPSTPGYDNNWINVTPTGGGNARGVSFTSGTTSTGVSVAAFSIGFYAANDWQSGGGSTSLVTLSGAANTLGAEGMFGTTPNRVYFEGLSSADLPAGWDRGTLTSDVQVWYLNGTGSNAAWVNIDQGSGPLLTQNWFLAAGRPAERLGTMVGPGVNVAAIKIVHLAEIPEPGTIILLGTGLLGLLAYAWRRRRA